MKRILFALFAFSFLLPAGSGQSEFKKFEITGGLGITQMFCDIGGYSRGENLLGLKDFSFKHTRFNISTGARYRVLENVAVRANIAFGCLHATDARGSNERRAFESKCLFIEPSLLGEFYILTPDESFVSTKGDRYRFKSFLSSLSPYVFAGVGGFTYKVNPNPVLEVRATSRRGFTGIIPAGAGVHLNYSDSFNFGMELGGRYSFSDDIEGYSSVYSKANDVYYFLNFTVAYKL
jgi:hypothetical protein